MLLEVYGIRFPGIGINIPEFAQAIKLPGISIPYMVVAVIFGIIIGYIFTIYEARRTWQDMAIYTNGTALIVIFGIIGARLFDVIINWSDYRNSPIHILNINRGGMNIAGALVLAVVVCLLIAYNKKTSVFRIMDTLCCGVMMGQLAGYVGSLFSRDSYGTYAKGKFAMQIPLSDTAGIMNQKIQDNIVKYHGTEYIQVHPLCIYKFLLVVLLLIFILVFRKRKRFDGELVAWCVWGQIVIRIIVDGAMSGRTILFWKISFAQAVEFICAAAIICVILVKRHKLNKQMESDDKKDGFAGRVISRFVNPSDDDNE